MITTFVYTCTRGPIAIAIVEAMTRDRVIIVQ